MKVLAGEMLGYAAASAVALAVDVGLLWILVHLMGCGVLTSATLAFIAGAAVAYGLSVKLAFKHHRLADRRQEFAGFVALGTVGLAVNSGVIFMGVRYFGLHVLIAKCIAASLTFSCNFVLRRQLLFTHRPYA